MQFTKINKSRHAAYALHVHLVFITKYRKPIPGICITLPSVSVRHRVCRDFGAELKECDGEADHVHMLIEYGPTVQLSVLVNSLKAVTSRRLRNEFLDSEGCFTANLQFLSLLSTFSGFFMAAPLRWITISKLAIDRLMNDPLPRSCDL